MSWYQKYRPSTFHELVDQSFAKKALPYALLHDKLVSSYLFSGPRGTGKTSTARIFAKALQCLSLTHDGNPCDSCDHCIAHHSGSFIDTIEIDAASNNSVENIRTLIEHAEFLPSIGRYKVYIIDEVHMLSSSAFNAFLKTLEEPPKHVKFLLATTERDKLPVTIISRTQRFEFSKISRDSLIARLEHIARCEGVEVREREGLEIIARLSDGGLRDAISLFEQFSFTLELDTQAIYESFGAVKGPILHELTTAYIKRQSEVFTSIIAREGFQVKRLLEDWLEYTSRLIRQSKNNTTLSEMTQLGRDLLQAYARLKTYPHGMIALDMLIAERCGGLSTQAPHIGYTPGSLPLPTNLVATSVPSANTSTKESFPPKKSPVATIPIEGEDSLLPSSSRSSGDAIETTDISERVFDIMSFIQLVDSSEGIHPTIRAILKKISFRQDGSTVHMTHSNKMEFKKLSDPEHLASLTSVIQKHFGSLSIELHLESKSSLQAQDIMDVF